MPNKKFRVWYKSTDYLYVDIEAENEEEAKEKAYNTDGGDFTADYGVNNVCGWDFDKVEDMEQK